MRAAAAAASARAWSREHARLACWCYQRLSTPPTWHQGAQLVGMNGGMACIATAARCACCRRSAGNRCFAAFRLNCLELRAPVASQQAEPCQAASALRTMAALSASSVAVATLQLDGSSHSWWHCRTGAVSPAARQPRRAPALRASSAPGEAPTAAAAQPQSFEQLYGSLAGVLAPGGAVAAAPTPLGRGLVAQAPISQGSTLLSGEAAGQEECAGTVCLGWSSGRCTRMAPSPAAAALLASCLPPHASS